jgi:hypothetical protein
LSQEGIKYSEWVERTPTSLLTVGSVVKIAAKPGEHVLYSRHNTEAWQFPCAEELDIILVFNAQERLDRRYIGRFHLCP